MYKLKRGEIMETKKVLQLLNNQYFKSLKRFEKVYNKINLYSKGIKTFNEGYLKLISAVLSGDVNDIRASLYGNLFYVYATLNEKDKLQSELFNTNH